MENTSDQTGNGPQLLGGFELFKPSIDVIILNIKAFLALALGPVAVMLIGVIVNGIFSNTNEQGINEGHPLGVLFFIIGGLYSLLAAPGIVVAQIKGARKEVIAPMDAFRQGMARFWRYLLAVILQGLVFIGAIICLIIPIFFAVRRYILVPYYVMDRDISVAEAFKQSAEDSITFKSPMWGLVGVEVLINALSFVPLVGWIPGVLYGCAPAVRYNEITNASKQLKSRENQSPQDTLKEVLG